jgi:hypothetical protein
MLEGIGHFDHSRYGFCIIHLCQGKTEGRDFYAFIAIEPQNYMFFKTHYRAGVITTGFEAYGRELLRGWGAAPSKDIIEHVSFKHRIDFVNGPHHGIKEAGPDDDEDTESPFLENATASGSV